MLYALTFTYRLLLGIIGRVLFDLEIGNDGRNLRMTFPFLYMCYPPDSGVVVSHTGAFLGHYHMQALLKLFTQVDKPYARRNDGEKVYVSLPLLSVWSGWRYLKNEFKGSAKCSSIIVYMESGEELLLNELEWKDLNSEDRIEAFSLTTTLSADTQKVMWDKWTETGCFWEANR